MDWLHMIGGGFSVRRKVVEPFGVKGKERQ